MPLYAGVPYRKPTAPYFYRCNLVRRPLFRLSLAVGAAPNRYSNLSLPFAGQHSYRREG